MTASQSPTRKRPPSIRPGWSLIELLVVVSIIAILLAILINTAAEGRGPLESTKISLHGLKAIFDEFEISTKQVPGTGTGGINSIQTFCTKVNTLRRTRDMLFNLGKDAAIDTDADGDVDLVKDGWGKEIYYNNGSGDYANGLPANRAAYFASAGPDGLWGTISSTAGSVNQPVNDGAKDNLYSYQLGN